MFIFLVKDTIYDVLETDILFYKTTSGVETPVTITGGVLGNIQDILDAIEIEYGIIFSGLFDQDIMTITLPGAIDSIDFKDLELGRWLGFSDNELLSTRWGTHRFMISDDVFLGHESSPIRPYEIESNFTLSGQVYKSTPGISTLFYDCTFGDYKKKYVDTGVIPFVENLESNVDMRMSTEGYEYFGGYFNSTIFQLNFLSKYLEPGDVLNSNKVRLEMSERPSPENGMKTYAFLTNSSGAYIILTDGSFVVKEI